MGNIRDGSSKKESKGNGVEAKTLTKRKLI